MATEFQTSGLSDALVILGAAGLVIPAFARFRITPVIGFLLIGLVVGPAGLGAMSGSFPWLHYVTISNPEAIEPFAELGIILLLFSIGLELSFKRLWGMRRLVFGVGAAELILGGFFIGIALYQNDTNDSINFVSLTDNPTFPGFALYTALFDEEEEVVLTLDGGDDGLTVAEYVVPPHQQGMHAAAIPELRDDLVVGMMRGMHRYSFDQLPDEELMSGDVIVYLAHDPERVRAEAREANASKREP